MAQASHQRSGPGRSNPMPSPLAAASPLPPADQTDLPYSYQSSRWQPDRSSPRQQQRTAAVQASAQNSSPLSVLLYTAAPPIQQSHSSRTAAHASHTAPESPLPALPCSPAARTANSSTTAAATATRRRPAASSPESSTIGRVRIHQPTTRPCVSSRQPAAQICNSFSPAAQISNQRPDSQQQFEAEFSSAQQPVAD